MNKIPQHPIDPYNGPPWYPTEPEEMTPEELEDEIVILRKWDGPGQDTAFDLGLSDNNMPAQGEGEYPRMEAEPEELLP